MFKIIYSKTWILNNLIPIIQNGENQILYNQEFFCIIYNFRILNNPIPIIQNGDNNQIMYNQEFFRIIYNFKIIYNKTWILNNPILII